MDLPDLPRRNHPRQMNHSCKNPDDFVGKLVVVGDSAPLLVLESGRALYPFQDQFRLKVLDSRGRIEFVYTLPSRVLVVKEGP